MDALLLGGNSQRNREWINKVGSELEGLFDRTIVHDYKHWQDGTDFVDIEHELKILNNEVAELGDYVIFAKSVGSILSLMLISGGSSGINKPKGCVFAGLALKLAEEEGIDVGSMLKSLDMPVVFVQNTNDPVGSFEKVKSFVEATQLKNVQFVETPGDDHSYDDLAKLKELIEGVF